MLSVILLSLLIKSQKNTKEDIEKILKTYRPDLINFLKAKLFGNISLAEDIFQDTAIRFIIAVNNDKAKFSNEKKIKNYLFTIAMNLFKNYYKKNCYLNKKIHFFNSDKELLLFIDKIEKKEKNPEEFFLKKEKDQRVSAIVTMTMSKISDKHKNVLLLRFFKSKKIEEISDILNLSRNAVDALIFRAKKSFEKTFRQIALKEDIYLIEDKKS